MSPRYLSPSHREMLRASGLSDETIELAGFETERDYLAVLRMLNRKLPARGARNPPGDWLVIRLYEPGQDEPYAYRLRPDHPRTVKTRGGKTRTVKYESPTGARELVYFAPRARSGGRYARDGLKVWTEGEKKAANLDQLGYTAVGLPGVDNTHDVVVARSTGVYQLHSRIVRNVKVEGCDHIICFDSDTREKAGVMRAAKRLAKMLLDAGAKSVRLAVPPAAQNGDKLGIDDYYTAVERTGASGAEAVVELFAAAMSIDATDLDTRPRVVLGPDEHRVIDDASVALVHAENIYSRGGRLVRVQAPLKTQRGDGTGHPPVMQSIGSLPLPSLREALTKHAHIVRFTEDGEQDEHPPKWLVEGLAARGRWPGVREIVGVVGSPVLRSDGSILSTNGYDEQTGLLLVLGEELGAIHVADNPTLADAKRACDELLEVVRDFPFSAPGHRSAWLASLLTMFARYAFDGPVPLILIVGNVRGLGKTLLADTTATIALGRGFARALYSDDDAEMRKTITARALSGDTSALLDNVAGTLGNAALDAALTGTTWDDRVLGESRMTGTLLLLILWFATGNNVSVKADTVRRTLPIRLDSPEEHPEDRGFFAHTDLLGYVRRERPRLIAAALTVLRAYFVAGRPNMGLRAWGSFEAWSRLVPSALVWCGQPDPSEARFELRAQGDGEALALRSVIEGLESMAPGRAGLTARAILERLDRPELPPALSAMRDALDDLVRVRRSGELPTPAQLGLALKSRRRRVVTTVSGLRALDGEPHRGTWHWNVIAPEASVGVVGVVGVAGSTTREDFDVSCASQAERDLVPQPQPLPPLPPRSTPEQPVAPFADYFAAHPDELERLASVDASNGNGAVPSRPVGLSTTSRDWARWYRAHPEELERDTRNEAAQ